MTSCFFQHILCPSGIFSKWVGVSDSTGAGEGSCVLHHRFGRGTAKHSTWTRYTVLCTQVLWNIAPCTSSAMRLRKTAKFAWYAFVIPGALCCGRGLGVPSKKDMVLYTRSSVSGVKVLKYGPLCSSDEWSTISIADRENLKKQTIEASEFWWVAANIVLFLSSVFFLCVTCLWSPMKINR